MPDLPFVQNVRTETNVLDPLYGAKGDAITDDTAAIQAAIDALPANGGTVFFPGGVYVVSGTLDVHGKRSLIFQGVGGGTAGASGASMIQYTGTGTLINAQSTYGFKTRDLMLSAVSASFAGRLVDLSHDATLQTDSAFWQVADSYLGITATAAGVAVYLDQAVDGTVERCNCVGGQYGVQGIAVGGHFSNSVAVRGTRFSGQGTGSISGVGSGWSICDSCIFETLPNGATGCILQGPTGSLGGTVSGNWFGDQNASITLVQAGNGMRISGNDLSSNGTSAAVSIGAGIVGAEVTGNTIGNSNIGISISPTAKDLKIFPNHYTGNNTNYTPPTVAAGAGAGTGATASITGSDNGGRITINTGTATAAGVIATVTLAWTHTITAPLLQNLAAAMGALGLFISATSGNSFTISTGAVPAATTTYTLAFALADTQ